MKNPIISPGSMLNTSEGLIATGALAALTTALTNSSDWRVQASSALGMAILAAAYVLARAYVKAGQEVEE